METPDRSARLVPVYRRVADSIIYDIENGILLPGDRLPTVRKLADDNRLSPGTAKHVYDVLEQEGYLVKEQGRGTFVKNVSQSGKALAMEAIDRLLDEMEALSFSLYETRIFLDLKMRQREMEEEAVHIAAVECSQEALMMMKDQLSSMEGVEVSGYLLDNILMSPHPFEPMADIIVTTTTHKEELEKKTVEGKNIVGIVMALSPETAIELSSIDKAGKASIVCKSPRFADVIIDAYCRYSKSKNPVETVFFGDEKAVISAVSQGNAAILPPNYRLFASPKENAAISAKLKGRKKILYWYQIEKGSMVFLEQMVKSLREKKGQKA